MLPPAKFLQGKKIHFFIGLINLQFNKKKEKKKKKETALAFPWMFIQNIYSRHPNNNALLKATKIHIKSNDALCPSVPSLFHVN